MVARIDLKKFREIELSTDILYPIGLVDVLLSVLVHAEQMATKYSGKFATLPNPPSFNVRNRN